MKIKSIRKMGPELYLVTYKRRWLTNIERYVIYQNSKPILGSITVTFYFRDSDELAHNCWFHIKWMIRNNVEFFDNFPKVHGKFGKAVPDLVIGPTPLGVNIGDN